MPSAKQRKILLRFCADRWLYVMAMQSQYLLFTGQ